MPRSARSDIAPSTIATTVPALEIPGGGLRIPGHRYRTRPTNVNAYLALLRELRAAAPTVRIVVFASRPEELVDAGAAGADAIIDQGEAPDGLRQLLARLLGR